MITFSLGSDLYFRTCHGIRDPMTSSSGFPDLCALQRHFSYLQIRIRENVAAARKGPESPKEGVTFRRFLVPDGKDHSRGVQHTSEH